MKTVSTAASAFIRANEPSFAFEYALFKIRPVPETHTVESRGLLHFSLIKNEFAFEYASAEINSLKETSSLDRRNTRAAVGLKIKARAP